MDLLGAYSSGDDDSDTSERSRTPPTPIQKTAVHPGAEKPSPTKTSPAAFQAMKNKSKRGKKLMSLHSVLPPHILEQLTRSEATGAYENSDSDDSDAVAAKETSQAKKQAPKKGSASSEDAGISNFLNALNSVQATTTAQSAFSANNEGQLKRPPPSSSNGSSDNDNKKQWSSSNLGSAFVSAVTTTTVRKKDGTTASTTTSSAREREDQPSTPTGSGSGGEHASPPPQSSPSHYKPLSLSPRTAFQPFRNTKTNYNIAAAPPVPMTTATSTTAATSQVPAPSKFSRRPAAPPRPQSAPYPAPSAQYTPPPAPPPPGAAASSYPYPRDEGPPPPSYPHYEEPEQPAASSNKRSRKRQLQKALRAGQLDTQALEEYQQVGNVTQLTQAEPNAFTPKEETYAVPTHGVKVVATQMYNPSAGTTVQADLGGARVKGKNQINHLMASAAQLELQQARQGGSKVNSQRAGAKRKYGW